MATLDKIKILNQWEIDQPFTQLCSWHGSGSHEPRSVRYPNLAFGSWLFMLLARHYITRHFMASNESSNLDLSKVDPLSETAIL